jgi:F-type H+-transporting ATPase subunit gamma
MSIADRVSEVSANADKIVIVYNRYKSAISSEIKKIELMPKKRFLESMKFQRLYNMSRPDASTTVPALYDLYVSANLYTALLNNLASEQTARMNAMENASKNAGEMIQKLQLEYNKARQTKITSELCEIISGASAV